MEKYLMMFLVVILAAGCNTMTGLGKDIQKGGEALEKAASK
jgi:predicted small secreted protein